MRDDDEDRPKKKRDEDEDRPRKRRADGADDEDSPRKNRRSEDIEDLEGRPRKKRRSEDNEDDDRPRKKRRRDDDDDDDDRPRKKRRREEPVGSNRTIIIAAAVGGVLLIAVIVVIIIALSGGGGSGGGAAGGPGAVEGKKITPQMLLGKWTGETDFKETITLDFTSETEVTCHSKGGRFEGGPRGGYHLIDGDEGKLIMLPPVVFGLCETPIILSISDTKMVLGCGRQDAHTRKVIVDRKIEFAKVK